MESNLENRINTLPDDILVSIVSRLKLKDAARSSVLCQRWRNLWTYTTGTLDFVRRDYGIQPNYAKRWSFIKWVNRVLNAHKGSNIDEFRVDYSLDERDSDVINSWIKFALERNVKRLVLYVPQYALGTQVFSSCRGSLTALDLTWVQVTGEVLGYILSKLLLLQTLKVSSSYSLKELKIAGPCPSLLRLEIVNCRSMSYLEVHAINLVSFTYWGPEISIHFEELPRLVQANLRGDVILFKSLCHFLSRCYQLESLVLELSLWNRTGLRVFPVLPKFKKLKQLEVGLSGVELGKYNRHCTALLKASPSLQRLVIKMDDIQGDEYGTKRRKREVKYKHKKLKVLEFVGFCGCRELIQLVQGMVDKLPLLEKLVVDLPIWLNLEKASRTHQQLRKLLPPGAELVITSC